jgi:ribosomal protein L39E
MATRKEAGKKIKLCALMKRKRAPVWASIRKFGLKRARTRRIRADKHRGRKKL